MRATFILSTGRCGTQSLTSMIGNTIGARAIVSHEPIKASYKPRLTLLPFTPETDPRLAEAEEHMRLVVNAVNKGHEYVETGWPAFTWFEQYHRRLGARWRFIHLVRNPVNVAASFATHRYYQPSRQDDFSDFAILQPTDAGVRFPEVAAEWPRLTVFDKCLYQWLEINSRLSSLAARGLQPVATVRFEEVFSDTAARDQLFERLGWPRPGMPIAHADRFHFDTDLPLTPTSPLIWQAVKDLARNFGYGEEDLDESLGRLQYGGPRMEGATAVGRQRQPTGGTAR